MDFAFPAYILQQQAFQPPDLPPPGFSVQQTQPQAPISISQTPPWTAQPQDFAASQPPLLSHPYVQSLKLQLDGALSKIREHEDTIVHQATVIRQSLHPLRTLHGIICPHCKLEVIHTCPSPTNSLQPLMSRYQHQPVTVSSPSGLTSSYPSLCPPGSSIPMHSQYNSSNGNSQLGKRDMHHADLHCEPGRKRARAFNDSFPLLAPTPTTSEAAMSPLVVPDAPATTSEDGVVASDPDPEQGSVANWSIQYNSEVERAVDIRFVRPLVERGISCLKFSPDGKYLAVGFGHNGMTNIYDVQSGKKTCALRDIINGKDLAISTICFSPDSRYLATWALEEFVRIWEVTKKHLRNVFLSPYEFHTGSIDFSPDGRLIAVGALVSLEIWNLRDDSRKTFGDTKSLIEDTRFSPDGKCIAVAVNRGVLIGNVRIGKWVKELRGHCSWVESVTFMPGGTRLVSGSWDRTVKVWDISLLGVDGRMEVENGSIGKELLEFKGHKDFVDFVGVSSDGRWMVSRSENQVCVWNAHNAELYVELTLQSDQVQVDFSPVGGWFVSAQLAERIHDEVQVLLWKIM